MAGTPYVLTANEQKSRCTAMVLPKNIKRTEVARAFELIFSEKRLPLKTCIYYSKNHHSDIIKITHPQNEDRLNSRFVLGWVIFSIILGG
jgi:hypothetical protein